MGFWPPAKPLHRNLLMLRFFCPSSAGCSEHRVACFPCGGERRSAEPGRAASGSVGRRLSWRARGPNDRWRKKASLFSLRLKVHRTNQKPLPLEGENSWKELRQLRLLRSLMPMLAVDSQGKIIEWNDRVGGTRRSDWFLDLRRDLKLLDC